MSRPPPSSSRPPSARPEAGLYRVYKPVGVTSFSLVRPFLEALERIPGKPLKVCHAGTLDPFAHGLLLMLVGPTTRLMELFHELPKRYVAEVRWGEETDTCDAGGKVVLSGDASLVTPDSAERALRDFLGWREQVPPLTSAKKVGGEPAYKKAHRGEVFELPPSRVYLHAARFVRHELPLRSVLELTCRGGYYVRALARDLGRTLGCGARLESLHRTDIGPWTDADLVPRDVEGLGATLPAPQVPWRGDAHVAGPDLVPWLRRRELTDAELGTLRQERPIACGALLPPVWTLPPGFAEPTVSRVAAVHQQRLLGLLRSDGDTLRAEWLFPKGL